MKYRGVKPAQQKAAPRRPKPSHGPSSRPSPTLLSDTDAGPRPVSQRQQATRAGHVTGADIVERLAPRRATPAVPPPGMRARTRRDAETTHVVRRRKQRTNRRRVDYLSLFLKSAGAALFVEIVAVLLFSPRLYVTKTSVEGNATISANTLLGELAIGPKQNLVRLPVGRLRKAILAANPMIETAEIRRMPPGTVRLVVHERMPWASVSLPDGSWYTIDKNLVPFRTGPQPEAGLPRLRISASAGTAPSMPVELGKPLATPGLDSVSRWLAWAFAHRFPIDSIEIAPDGKLCLNRTGNLQVQVGTEMDLDKKIKSISTLLESHPDLRTRTDVAYINLFAWDAPAILPRVVPPGHKTDASEQDAVGSTASSPAASGSPDQVTGPPQ